MDKIYSRNITPFVTESEVFVYEGNTGANPNTNGCLYQYDRATGRIDTIALFMQKENLEEKQVKGFSSFSVF